MRNCEEKEERLMLLESWRDFEREFGSESSMERVRKLLPDKVKKRRKLTAEDGVRTATCLKGICIVCDFETDLLTILSGSILFLHFQVCFPILINFYFLLLPTDQNQGMF